MVEAIWFALVGSIGCSQQETMLNIHTAIASTNPSTSVSGWAACLLAIVCCHCLPILQRLNFHTVSHDSLLPNDRSSETENESYRVLNPSGSWEIAPARAQCWETRPSVWW